MGRWDHYDQAAITDRILYREAERMTVGASAFHQMDPSEVIMAIEETDAEELALRERSMIRNEIFSGFAEYLFADGPCPEQVRARIEGFFRSFSPEIAEKVHGPKEWVHPVDVAAVLRKHHKRLTLAMELARSRGALSVWWRELQGETDLEWVRKILVALIELLVSEGHTWRHVTAVAYCIAKALRPALIADMPLADIATLSGDEGGRATPSDRIKRIYSRRVEAAGGKGTHVHFQKSASTVAKYQAAQQGNCNRSKKRKRKPRRKP